MAVDDPLFGEAAQSYPVRDEVTGEVVSDPDGFPIVELESADYFDLGASMSIEERASGERAWRFGHVIVDEAQDLTPMQWRMIGRRARGNSMTIVGDVAQRTTGEVGTWDDLLPASLGTVEQFDLSTNYRSPGEIEPYAHAVLDALDPTLVAPISIRQSGHPLVVHSLEGDASHVLRTSTITDLARDLVGQVDGGRVAVIATSPWEIDDPQIRCLTPSASKGMEFDGVIVVEPAEMLEEPHGLGLLYVALTRSTDHLVLVHSRPLPAVLAHVDAP
jgi:DNA helicase IV